MLHREEGISRGELFSLQLRMLEANGLPHLLKLDIEEINCQVKMLYRLSSKRMLSQALKLDGITWMPFIKMIHAIVTTIKESKMYMLSENQFLLNEDFIFVGHDALEPYLVYVPMQLKDVDAGCQAQMKALLQQIGSRLKDGRHDDLAALVDACRQSEDLDQFAEVLLEIMDASPASVSAAWKSRASKDDSRAADASNALSSDRRDNFYSFYRQEDNLDLHEPLFKEKQKEPDTGSIAASGRSRGIGLSACVLIVLALLYLFFHPRLSFEINALTAGTMLLLLICAIYAAGKIRYIGRWMPEKKQTIECLQQTGQVPGFSAGESTRVDDYYEQLSQHTSLLPHRLDDRTMLLAAVDSAPRRPSLEWTKAGNLERIELSESGITIGRLEGEVDVKIEEAGVSRLHAQIGTFMEGYAIKDLGSTNGTFLKGERLVPYQCYELKDGDAVLIASTIFTFCE